MADLCSSIGSNTGKPACDVPFGSLRYLIRTGENAFLSAAEAVDSTTVEAALIAKANLPISDPQKIVVFPVFETGTNNTGDPTTATLGTLERVLRDATPKYQLEAGNVGLQQNQALCAWNGSQGRILAVDSNGRLFGILQNNGDVKGFSYSDIYTSPPQFAGTDEFGGVKSRITYANADEFKVSNIYVVALTFLVSELPQLQDIVISIANITGNVITVKGKTKYGGTDIYSSHSAALNNIARWVITNEDTQAAVVIDSVALNTGLKGWALTSAAFGALAANTNYSINLASPAVLYAANVKEIEGIKVAGVKL